MLDTSQKHKKAENLTPNNRVNFDPISFPLTNLGRLEADKYIPFDRDEVCIDGQRIESLDAEEEPSDEMKSLLVAVKKDLPALEPSDSCTS